MPTEHGMGRGTVQVPAKDGREEQEENERRIRGKQEQHERATRMHLPCRRPASGFGVALAGTFQRQGTAPAPGAVAGALARHLQERPRQPTV